MLLVLTPTHYKHLVNHRLGERARPASSTSTTPHQTIAKHGRAAHAQEEEHATTLSPHSAMFDPKTGFGTSRGAPFIRQLRQHTTPPKNLRFTAAPSKSTAPMPPVPRVPTQTAPSVLFAPPAMSCVRLVSSAPPKALGQALAFLPVFLSFLLL